MHCRCRCITTIEPSEWKGQGRHTSERDRVGERCDVIRAYCRARNWFFALTQAVTASFQGQTHAFVYLYTQHIVVLNTFLAGCL
jgi:hypothetical protein